MEVKEDEMSDSIALNMNQADEDANLLSNNENSQKYAKLRKEKNKCLKYLLLPFDIIFGIIAWLIVICIVIPFIVIFILLILIFSLIFYRCLRAKILRFGGLRNWVRKVLIFTPYFGWFFWIILHIPYVRTRVRIVITTLVLRALAERLGEPIGLVGDNNDHHSYESIYEDNRATYHRWLKQCDDEYLQRLPSIEKVIELFIRPSNGFIPNEKVSVTFAYTAQWFTHNLFHTDIINDNINRVNMKCGPNLSILYGTSKEQMDNIRSFKDGKLKSVWINNEEFPEIIDNPNNDGLMKGDKIFNFQFSLANMQPGMAAINILFFRHHQYIATSLKQEYGENMNDGEIFSIARLINILCLQSVICNGYIDGVLKPGHAKVKFDSKVSTLWDSFFYRLLGPRIKNVKIGIEFNLMYRFHQLIPDQIQIDKHTKLDLDDGLSDKWNSCKVLTAKNGMKNVLEYGSKQAAGKLTLLNTNEWLARHVVGAGLKSARKWKLCSYNDYREKFGFPRIKDFDDICNDKQIVEKLREVYKDNIDDIEYYVGIWAEENELWNVNGALNTEIAAMWAYIGIFMNRLNLQNLDDIILPLGVQILDDTNSIHDLIRLHLPGAKVNFCCE